MNAAFDFFDLDNSGELSPDELFEIGKAMHPGGKWTKEQNEKAIKSLDEDGNGTWYHLVLRSDRENDRHDFWVHGTINIVKQIKCFINYLLSLFLTCNKVLPLYLKYILHKSFYHYQISICQFLLLYNYDHY